MSYPALTIENLSLFIANKHLLSDFSASISNKCKIGIIGRNGSGKSTLIKAISGLCDNYEGSITPYGKISYISQIIEQPQELSGGERFNKALSKSLALQPDILILDEPTNHLDSENRRSLLKMLKNFHGALLIATHDIELLDEVTNTIWHFEQGKIRVFQSNYTDLKTEIEKEYSSIQNNLNELSKKKKSIHERRMKEQARASTSKASGQKNIKQRKWPTVVSNAKAHRAQTTFGKNSQNISTEREKILNKLSDTRLPEAIKPRFNFSSPIRGNEVAVSISKGSCGYSEAILNDVSLNLKVGEKLALKGKNGSGKSTLVRAILNDERVIKQGSWYALRECEIGYLDQHYSTLDKTISVFDNIKNLIPNTRDEEIRKILNDFLFRKNEEVNMKAKDLSGGEKARLSLAQISAKTPKLLILDEITNNIDLETKEHVISVLREYKGALLIISHDDIFLEQLDVDRVITLP